MARLTAMLQLVRRNYAGVRCQVVDQTMNGLGSRDSQSGSLDIGIHAVL
jgi:hypothetical protein